MLRRYHSNRMEALLEALIQVTQSPPPADPFAAEVIVVGHQGMGRWIAQQLAEKTGISARLDFPSPTNFFWRVLKAFVPDAPDQSTFEPEALTWRVLRGLPELLGLPAFADLQRYLRADDSDLRRYQLARRIADLFDQYLIFRPERVLGWEQHQDEHWQALLWRALCADSGNLHIARLLCKIEPTVTDGRTAAARLPERVSLFGLHGLAPMYCQLLDVLARHTEIHVFCLNPSRVYRSERLGEQDRSDRHVRRRQIGLPDFEVSRQRCNPLLASLGHTGQVFLQQLLELSGRDQDRFVDPQGPSLLHRVQRDLLDDVDPRTRDPIRQQSVDAADGSIQVHSAHSRLREIQILHDRLLRAFQTLEGLEPRDIVVLAPDIDAYAPFIEAVFGTAASTLRIPWSIADRRLRTQHALANGLQKVLALPGSRFEASEVLSLLQLPAVQRCFDLDEVGLERIRAWVKESGVRWGTDAAMREALALPREMANTWEFGLQRLFLGYALPPDPEAELYADVLPYGDVEGSEVGYLGALQSFLDTLTEWRRQLAEPRSVRAWQTALNQLLTDCFAPDPDEALLLQRVRERLDSVVFHATAAGFEGALSLEVVRSLLETVFEDSSGAWNFLTGRLTFGNLVPMRSLPFRVVCLIGLNGTDFPRRQRALSFDLMAQAPRRTDPCRRHDDRYLFLEALLSARDLLYLSYVGNDTRDHSVKVPSVLVSELLDYLRQGDRLRGGGDRMAHRVVRHPLQPFSGRYFDGQDTRLFSYAAHWLETARSEAQRVLPRFVDGPLPSPDEALRVVAIEDLITFLKNPAHAFLTQRLRLRLPQEDETLEDEEPFDAAGLERYQLRQSLLRQRLVGREPGVILERLRAEGTLPHGTPGALLFEEELNGADQFRQRLARYGADALPTLPVDRVLGDFRLQGELRNLRADGVLDYRFAKLRAKHRLAVWVRHLVLNVLAPQGVVPRSVFLAEDHTLTFEPVAGARALLQELLQLRWQGLCAPLAFFPESALAWIEEDGYKSRFDYAWCGVQNPVPEANDRAVRMAFRGVEPIGEAFEHHARTILQPMREHSQLVKVDQELS